MQRNLHLFGRYGITMFAISGLDIALWDLAAKIKGVPLHQLIGGAKRAKIPAYASLLRIGKPEDIASECTAARKLGYSAIKLHETTTPAVFAARKAIGDGVPLMVDMNCPLSGTEAIAFAHACRDAAPCSSKSRSGRPRISATLAELRRKGGLRYRRRRECLHRISIPPDDDAGAVSHAQPSVIKVGGVTEFLKVAAAGDELGVKIIRTRPIMVPAISPRCI